MIVARVVLSRVGNAVDNLVGDLVLEQLSLIDSFEVARQTLCLHWVHDRGAFLHSLRGVRIHEAEVLECLRVCRCEIEVSGNISAQPVMRKKKLVNHPKYLL